MQNERLITLVAIFLMLWGATCVGQVAVIAHKEAPVDTIKKSELLDFYTGDIKKWSDDRPVVVLDLKPQTEVKDLFYKFLGKSPSRMKSIWLKKMLSGEGDPPDACKSEEEMLKKVAETPGAIGFVSSKKLNGKVKTLAIILKETR